MAVGSLGQLTLDLVANTAGFERGMNQAERAVASTTKAIERQEAAADKLVGQIDPIAGALQRVVKQQVELEKHFKAGIVPEGEYKRLNAILEAQANAVQNTNGQFAKGAISAKQYAAALRNVPAQFTDIAVSLQAGQAPLTVLLQQGGQLKDMFGGVGGAAKALGGYVLGLVNPFTVAAAAAAVLALAYKQGSDEQTAFQNALILTGNAAGTSSQALAQQAQDISKTVGTVGAAAAVLTQLASSGKIPASQFDMIAVAALKLQEATGIAAEETVKNFEKLAKDPVKYSKELNESLNYLTASQYAQIDALQRQGDAQGAANLAEQAYAEALTTRANAIKENLGYVETAWKSVTAVAKGAWDAFLDIGREDTLEQKLSKLEKGLNDIAQRSSGPILFDDNPDLGALGAGQKGLQDEIGKTLQAYQDETEAALKAGKAAADQKAGIDAYEKFAKGLEDGATKAQKLEKAIRDINKEAAAAAKAGLTIPQADIDKRIAQVRDQYKPDKEAKPKAYQDDAGQKMLATLREQAAALQLQSETTEKLGAQAQALAKFNQQIADIKNKDILTADQKSLLASEDLIRAQLKRNVGLEQEVAARKSAADEAAKLAAFTENQRSKLDQAQAGLDSELAGVGMGEKARQRLKEDIAIQKEYQDQKDKLNRSYNSIASPTQSQTDTYGAETKVLEEALAERLVMQQDHYNQVDELKNNYFAGMSESWANYVEEATNYQQQAADATSNILNSLTTSIADNLESLIKGQESIGDFFKNIAADLASSIIGALVKMAAQWLVYQGVQLLVGATTSAAAVGEAAVAGPAIAAAYAPAAALASLASFGANSIPATAALITTTGVAQGLALTGMAHDGIDSVPQDGTWLLQKGERVTTAQTSAKLDKTLNDIKSPSNMGSTTVNLIEDASRAGQVQERTGDQGEKMIDAFVADLLGDGRTKDAMSTKFGLRSVGS
jgi:lambda family phage tail tape measure protein